MLLKKAFLPDVWLSSFVFWFYCLGRVFVSPDASPFKTLFSEISASFITVGHFRLHRCCLVFGIFRVALLFICQGSVVFVCCSCVATLISYHRFSLLSTPFFNFFHFVLPFNRQTLTWKLQSRNALHCITTFHILSTSFFIFSADWKLSVVLSTKACLL